MKKAVSLSKSRIVNGIQCSKRLYLEVHNPEIMSQVSEGQQAIFDQGHEVGFEAQKLYPEGILIEGEYWDTPGAVKKTNSAIEKGAQILFEATAVHGGVSARADIFKKSRDGSWEIIEVKSTTSVKDQHLDDAAIQLWIFRGYGFKVKKISIMHINNQYLLPTADELFTKIDVTEEVELRLKTMPQLMKNLFKVINGAKPPKIDIGPHCDAPYECPFKEHCWEHIPTPSVFDIPRIGRRAWDYYLGGKFEIKKIKEEGLNEKHAVVLNVFKTGKRHVDRAKIKSELKNWDWPLYFLDFESFNPAIPLYELTRPYQQIPFQFSCHVLEKPNSKLKHFEYLHLDDSDPREFVAKALAEGFGSEGSVVAYNKAFESGVLSQLAKLFPKYGKKLLSIKERLVDPLPIFQNSVYDKNFLGSFSLKSVAPALLGKEMSYEGLTIGDGSSASQSYLLLMKGKLSKAERRKTIRAMLEYCRQDTLATIGLVKWLLKEAG